MNKEIKENLTGLMITLGTDTERKFAWCLRKINNRPFICIHKRKDGYSKFNENDFITAFSIDVIKDINNEYIIKNYKICFPEFDRNLIFKNTNLFYSIKYSGVSWFYTMQDRITFVKLMMGIVNKEIINN